MAVQVQDLWASDAGPNVLAWSYASPGEATVYTVYVAHPGGTPRLQLRYEDGRYDSVPITEPERFGRWDTPRNFAAWARAWKDATDHAGERA